MSKNKHSPEFKKRIAIEALREQKSLYQIARDNGISPSQVSLWRKQLLDQSGSIFEPTKSTGQHRCDHEELIEILERKVGRLTIENDFLKKKLDR